MSHVERAALRAELATAPTPEYASAATRPSSTSCPDVAPGAAVERPGQARQTRLSLAPAVREKLERLEAVAAAAHAEVLRLGDLLADERDQLTRLEQREATWKANYYHGVDQSDVAALQAERVASADETARLTAVRETAHRRWQRLARVAEHCRQHLGLPADGRRN